jgi:hypothetical protein
MEEKDRKYYSNPSLSKTFGLYSPPIPASMLAEMAALKIQEEGEVENSNSSKDAQTGEGRSGWHRTTRATGSTSQTMEMVSNIEAILTKRQRTEEGCGVISENLVAGPARQASQKP